jgi:hypothetical protein
MKRYVYEAIKGISHYGQPDPFITKDKKNPSKTPKNNNNKKDFVNN